MANHSNPRLKAVEDRNKSIETDQLRDSAVMSQIDDLFLKLDHLQSTISAVAIDIVQLREHQSSQKENNQRFLSQDWPAIINSQKNVQDKCNAIERELSELKPILKQIVDHEQRLREVEKSVIKMGVIASFVGAAFGAIVTWVIKFVKFG